MGRYLGPVCRLCRREGMCLSLKGKRSLTGKCGIVRITLPPGQHGQRRIKMTPYGRQLREKQRMKRVYGMLEGQFRQTFGRAERMKGVTGENLLALLERRLDRIVYRLGFAATQAEARQLVTHGHIVVNGGKLDRPSAVLRPGAVVEVREKSRGLERINEALDDALRQGIRSWVELDRGAYRGTLKSLPERQELTTPSFEEHLVVEHYSK
ncbi:MAG: 30S ribosomal protein S4 [Desulfuromonadales bacterium]|nr:30S ribosomal protein S4 [Desulfuromonadales bacterium]